MTTMVGTVTIREFQPGDQAAFERINAEWITRHFKLEPKDLQSLQDPQGVVLDRGGRVFFAVETVGGEERVLGCCALVLMSPGEYEVSKMGVTQAAQGRGVGRTMLTHVVQAAKDAGAKRLYLETNHTLGPAIHLYEATGFRPVPAERRIPSPYSRADVFMEQYL
jgi:putative acetyltransferase